MIDDVYLLVRNRDNPYPYFKTALIYLQFIQLFFHTSRLVSFRLLDLFWMPISPFSYTSCNIKSVLMISILFCGWLILFLFTVLVRAVIRAVTSFLHRRWKFCLAFSRYLLCLWHTHLIKGWEFWFQSKIFWSLVLISIYLLTAGGRKT
jgi:hypothetical protein